MYNLASYFFEKHYKYVFEIEIRCKEFLAFNTYLSDDYLNFYIRNHETCFFSIQYLGMCICVGR